MQQFDVVLKVLLRSSMEQITGNRVVNWLPTELARVQNLRVDLLGETDGGDLMHIEVQTLNDREMPFRMLRYLNLIIDKHRRIPRQVLLYIGREPLRMKAHFTWPDGSSRFAIIDMRDVDGEPLLASPEPSDNVLAILAKLKDSRAAVQSILKKISGLPGDDLAEYYQALMILAGLRDLADTVQEETETVFTIDLSENTVLGPAYLRGREEGREEGRGEGRHQELQAMLRRLIERRFGSFPAWVEQKLALSSIEDLEEVVIRVLDAQAPEELFR